MGVKTFSRGDIIFRQGDPGDCMFDIQSGAVDIYVNFGGTNEKKIAGLSAGDLFGEMSLIDYSPRSATAVVSADDTEIRDISKDEFVAFFKKEPIKIINLLQQMCDRVTKTTQDYLEACRTLYERQETGAEKDADLQARIRKFSNLHKDFDSRVNA
ncbi:Cyclic nucleotide-binding domain-containing protein [Sarcina sp. DSM 11001]|uniref:cyclic nucleotide-binding domain-containing protein n=1 Tax=Sarcina sp. DSM 11001 TaxID=1798184 RepID=UPI000880C4C3|nr:cyclic nucleotide-binding domain-containing protein [Sarcina sp. DSM 11001]SDK66788.1 Cyclic nucleotide-binding domain-containing protein [Sarcina sp. DSM 11001]